MMRVCMTDAALTQCKLWAIDRSVFKTILTRTGMQKHADHVDFLKRFLRSVDGRTAKHRICSFFSNTSRLHSSSKCRMSKQGLK